MEPSETKDNSISEPAAYLQGATLFFEVGPNRVYNKPVQNLVDPQFSELLSLLNCTDDTSFHIPSKEFLPEKLGKHLGNVSLVGVNAENELELRVVCEEMRNDQLGYVPGGKIKDIMPDHYRETVQQSYELALNEKKAIAQTNVLNFENQFMCHERLMIPVLPEDLSDTQNYKLLICSIRSKILQDTMRIRDDFYRSIEDAQQA